MPPDPYPFRIVRAPVPPPLRPTWWEILASWATCLGMMLAAFGVSLGVITLVVLAVWRLWP